MYLRNRGNKNTAFAAWVKQYPNDKNPKQDLERDSFSKIYATNAAGGGIGIGTEEHINNPMQQMHSVDDIPTKQEAALQRGSAMARLDVRRGGSVYESPAALPAAVQSLPSLRGAVSAAALDNIDHNL